MLAERPGIFISAIPALPYRNRSGTFIYNLSSYFTSTRSRPAGVFHVKLIRGGDCQTGPAQFF